MQIFLYVQRIVEVNRDFLSGKVNLSVKCKQFGIQSSEKIESDIDWNREYAIFDLKVICPLSIESVVKMEQNPWIVELYNTDLNESLVGILKLPLNQIPIMIFDQASPSNYIKLLNSSLNPIIIHEGDFVF
jgi:hypothetical protein